VDPQPPAGALRADAERTPLTSTTASARAPAVALLSAGTVAFEILLVRVFAIEYFHHFAYMAIGVAMLGFGASGTLWALAGRAGPDTAHRWFARAAVLAALSLVASPALVHLIDLDPTQLPWDVGQWRRLAAVYGLLALPFGLGALAILLALTLEPDRPGRIYGASFLGAGLGAALSLAVLWIAFPARALALPAVLASLGAVAAARSVTPSAPAAAGAVLAVAVAVLAFLQPLWRIAVTPYKGLPQVEAYPDARRVAERTSPLGWVVAVGAPAFRYAPGLSLAFRGDFPPQTALFVDGQIAGAASHWDRERSAAALLGWLPSAAPYALGNRQQVLVIGAGGGTEVWNALAHGAQSVTAVELHPDLIELTQALAPPRGRPGTRVEWVAGDARSYVARARERFDLVTLGPAGGFGAAAAGVHSLNEDFLHTVEAYEAYLARLSDRGVLAVTRWLTVPPRDIVRVILTAAEALRRSRPPPAGAAPGLAVVRSWGTATVLVKPSGLTSVEIEALRRWATERRFDLDWYPGLKAPSPAAAFNVLDEPTLFLAAAAAAAGPERAARFAASYPFAVAPADDSRPYPHHFLRTRSLGAFLQASRGSWLPFAEWGYIALLATLGQSVALAALLMVLPVAGRSRATRERPTPALLGYFTAIGLGYLAAEIAAIQQLGLLLGHPVYAVAAVLAVFLVCSGAGSVWSDRVSAARGRIAAMGLAGLLVIYGGLLLDLVHLLQPAHAVVRAGAAVLLLAPPAFFMGVPFPVGLRALAGPAAAHTGVAWAWAANGFASVVAAPLAALIALEVGSAALFLVAAAAYAAAAGLQGTARGSGPT